MELDEIKKLQMAKEENKNQISHSSSGGESEDYDDGSDFIDSSMDKKLNILLIPHIIFWKMANQNGLKLENGQVV